MYLLVEQIMNGTVTLQIIPTGVTGDSFKEAVSKVRVLPNLPKANIQTDTETEFSYFINGQFPCYGKMENKILKVI